MRRRDNTHLRNSRFLVVLILFLCRAGAQNPGDAFPPQVAQPKALPAQQDPKPDPPKDAAYPGQEQSGQDDQGFVFHKQVEEVVLHATVVDDKQRMVMNLDKSAFNVLEDGKPQNIVSFRREDIPVAMGIVIENY